MIDLILDFIARAFIEIFAESFGITIFEKIYNWIDKILPDSKVLRITVGIIILLLSFVIAIGIALGIVVGVIFVLYILFWR